MPSTARANANGWMHRVLAPARYILLIPELIPCYVKEVDRLKGCYDRRCYLAYPSCQNCSLLDVSLYINKLQH
jgi:hypothetical protein